MRISAEKRKYVSVPPFELNINALNADIDLEHIEKPLDRHELYRLTDNWFQVGNGLLFSGFAVLFFMHHAHKTQITQGILTSYSCGWNYFYFLARVFMHIYNFIEIARSHGAKKKLIVLEIFDAFGTLIIGAGTALSFFFTPLASFTPAIAAFFTSFVELIRMHRAYQRTCLPYLLRDRMKQYSRIKEKYKDIDLKDSGNADKNELLVAMREQVLAAVRVAYFKGEISSSNILKLLQEFGLENDDYVNSRMLHIAPTNEQKELVLHLQRSELVNMRHHAFNTFFWFVVGVGVSLASVATFFFPPLLLPAILVIALAAVIKGSELLELDRRIANCFRSKEKQAKISGDNAINNYFARRYKENDIKSAYLRTTRMQGVPKYNQCETLSDDVRVKLRLAYELSKSQCDRMRVGESQFYQQVLKLSWWRRRKMLSSAMEMYVERQALSHCSFAKGLNKREKEAMAASYCRADYRLFGRAKRVETVSEGHHKVPVAPSKCSY